MISRYSLLHEFRNLGQTTASLNFNLIFKICAYFKNDVKRANIFIRVMEFVCKWANCYWVYKFAHLYSRGCIKTCDYKSLSIGSWRNHLINLIMKSLRFLDDIWKYLPYCSELSSGGLHAIWERKKFPPKSISTHIRIFG